MTDKKTIIPNSFQTPNAHVDHAMQFLSGDEYKVLNFAVRHILGWHDRVTDRKGRISLTTFCDGFTTKTGEHYGGTGLSRQGIVDIVERLDNWGLLIKDGEPTAAGQEYTIGTDPDWELIISDHSESKKGNKARGEKLRAAKAAKKADDQSMPQTSSLSDRPVVYEIDGAQSIGQTDDQSMPQTHSNTSSNSHSNPQGNTNTSLPDGNVIAPNSTTHKNGAVNGNEKRKTFEEKPLDKANAGQNLPPIADAPPKNHFGHYLALLEAYGYEEAKVTKAEKSNFMAVAVQLHKASFPVDRVVGLYGYVCDKAKRGNWTDWTVNALANHASAYLKKAPAPIAVNHTTTYAPEPYDDTPQETVNERRAQQWQIIYEALELQLDKANFDMWLRDARLLEFNEDTQAFVVGVRNESAQQFLSYRLNREIDSVLRDVASGLVDIRWTA